MHIYAVYSQCGLFAKRLHTSEERNVHSDSRNSVKQIQNMANKGWEKSRTHSRAREKSNTATRPEPQTKKQRLQTEPASQCAINETFFSSNANICVIKCEACHFCPHLSHRLNFDAISNICQPKPSQSKPNQRLLQPNRTKSKSKIKFICVNFIEFRSMQNVQTTNYTLDAERIVWNVTLNAHYKKSLDIAQAHTKHTHIHSN